MGRSYAPSVSKFDFMSELAELHNYKLLKLLDDNPNLSQREAADVLGISLGKVNYCLRALIDKGWVKIQNFINNKNKLAYSYLLTPHGIEEKARLLREFYEIKKKEYEELKKEVELLKTEE